MNPELGTVITLLVYGAMACYVVAMVAFAVDVSALGIGAKPDRRRRAAGIGMSVIWLAVVLNFVAIVLRGLAAGRVPWANMYEFTLMFTFFLVALFVGIQRRRDIRYLGVGVALLAFLALFLATAVLYVEADGVQPALDSYWLVIHVSVATLATGLFGLSALASVLQLVKGRREERRAEQPDPAIVPGGDGSADGDGGASVAGGGPRGEHGSRGGGLTVAPARTRTGPSVLDRVLAPLPASADLERFAYRLNAVAFVAWTFVLVAGAIWAEHAWGRPWGWDPKETWTFVIWVIYAAYLHARVTTGWAAQRFAYFALTGFVALLANFYIVNIFFDGRHSYSGL